MKSIFVLSVLLSSTFAFAQAHTPTGTVDQFSCPSGSDGKAVSDTGIDTCLKTDGVRLEVHGLSVEDQTAVVTFRDPKNFFIYRHFSLITKDRALKTEIFKLKRHDIVIVKGSLARFQSPQKHILATALTVENVSDAHDGMGDYKYETPPEEVLAKTNLTAVVHGIFENGSILVLEYGDRVIPVYVEPRYAPLAKDLYRSDVIEINYSVQDSPGHPIHLNLTGNVNGKVVAPLTVKESILAQSGKQVEMTGELVLYPKSPQIQFNIFALKQDLGNGLRRYYTLVNVEDPVIFEAIRTKLQAVWDSEATGRKNDRNKWINTKITVHAIGTSNTQDPNQANPQILLKSADDVDASVK